MVEHTPLLLPVIGRAPRSAESSFRPRLRPVAERPAAQQVPIQFSTGHPVVEYTLNLRKETKS